MSPRPPAINETENKLIQAALATLIEKNPLKSPWLSIGPGPANFGGGGGERSNLLAVKTAFPTRDAYPIIAWKILEWASKHGYSERLCIDKNSIGCKDVKQTPVTAITIEFIQTGKGFCIFATFH